MGVSRCRLEEAIVLTLALCFVAGSAAWRILQLKFLSKCPSRAIRLQTRGRVKKDGVVTTTGRIVVSADGKTRTVTTSGTDPQGKKFKNTAVYDKQ